MHQYYSSHCNLLILSNHPKPGLVGLHWPGLVGQNWMLFTEGGETMLNSSNNRLLLYAEVHDKISLLNVAVTLFNETL